MKRIHTQVDVDAPAASVWQILADFGAYAAWNPLIPRASGHAREGAEVDMFIAPPGLASKRTKVRLVAVDRERELRWLGRFVLPKLLDGDHRYRLTPLSDDRVRVVQEECFDGLLVPLVAHMLVPRMTAAFEASNDALKTHAERTWRQGARPASAAGALPSRPPGSQHRSAEPAA